MSTRTPSTAKGKIDVILVEDLEEHAELLSRAFARHDRFSVRVVGSLDEAKGAMSDSLPDLIVTDLVLPDGRGTELLGSPRTEVLPIVVMTGHGDENAAVEAIKGGALDYVVKSPDSFAAMPDIAERALGEWREILERRRADAERRQVEAEVLHTQKLESLGILASGIAHDFNNLLCAILGNAEFAAAALPAGSGAAEHLEVIVHASGQAAELCHQLLAYSGKGQFVLKACDLSELVSETMPLLRISVPKSTSLEYELAEDIAPVQGDTTQLRQVIMNVVTNAAEAIGEEGGTIRVATGVLEVADDEPVRTTVGERLQAGQYVWLEVTDPGRGMDTATLAKVFDPFFTTKRTGRGLGLAAVLGIVRGHSGSVQVDSRPGRGTAFRVLIPSSTGKCEPAAAVPVPTDEWRGGGKLLVVDDEPWVRDVAAQMLERRGFTVLQAADGQEAVRLFSEQPESIVFVLLDLTMPKLSGKATLRALRRVRPDVKVLLMSGFSEEVVNEQFLGDGFQGFLMKPFRAEDLLAKVRQLLA